MVKTMANTLGLSYIRKLERVRNPVRLFENPNGSLVCQGHLDTLYTITVVALPAVNEIIDAANEERLIDAAKRRDSFMLIDEFQNVDELRLWMSGRDPDSPMPEKVRIEIVRHLQEVIRAANRADSEAFDNLCKQIIERGAKQ